MKTGKNVIAIRLYEPIAPASFTSEPRLGPISLSGEWMAKAETTFPPTTPEILATAPTPPAFFRAFQFTPSTLFNGMINPILPYAIKGAIWYQGETNVIRAWQYRTALPLLINDWRQQWKQETFHSTSSSSPTISPRRLPRARANGRNYAKHKLSPQNPRTPALLSRSISAKPTTFTPATKRMSASASLSSHWRMTTTQSVAASGPTYESAKILPGKIVLSFKNTTGGLVAKPLPSIYDLRSLTKETAPLVRNNPDSQLEGFAICGADKKWVWADAKIEGDKVVVSSKEVSDPIAVRYAWSDNPTCNLYNKAGLPASPFRTDDFP